MSHRARRGRNRWRRQRRRGRGAGTARSRRAEAAKRERRKVLALNKLGDAAASVRREFVRKLLARKTLPKGAATFVADCLVRDSYMLTQHDGPSTAAELLGIDAAAIHKAVSDLPAGSDNRALVIALALVLGSLESRTGKDAWRNPAPVREPGDDRIYYGRSVTCGDYLRFLAANGYTLSAVEEVVTGTRTGQLVGDNHPRHVSQALEQVGWPEGVAPSGSHRSVREPLDSYGSCHLDHQTAGTAVVQTQWAKNRGYWVVTRCHACWNSRRPWNRRYFLRTQRIR